MVDQTELLLQSFLTSELKSNGSLWIQPVIPFFIHDHTQPHTLLSVIIVIVPSRHSRSRTMKKRLTTVNEYDLNE